MKRYKLIIISLILAGSFSSCEKALKEDHKDGILPLSIEQVVDVFELKYGEVKECNYDGQILKFSIVDVEDKVIPNLMTGYIMPDDVKKLIMTAFLRSEIEKNVFNIKINSIPHGPYEYNNDGLDVQHIWLMLENFQFDNFLSLFVFNFGEGTLINNTPFSIYMAKAYPFAYYMKDKPDISMYKFIFIITN